MMVAKKFVSGGTVQASNGIYIARQADQELYQLCMEGEYATVLTARQRGKSSLMVNVTDQLRQASIHVATVDISPFGHQANPDDWYSTILEIIASSNNLNLELDVIEWWESQAHAYPLAARRFSLFFESLVLKELQGKIVIFIDEIDKTFSLPFTDDFFIGVRAMYNQRSQDAEFQRLSFVLLGVASPTELIKSKTSTPYNIGKQIELADFTRDELRPFQDELVRQTKISEDNASAITLAIFTWTSGHPYLTQRLFKEIATRNVSVPDLDTSIVDEIVSSLFLRPRTALDNNIIEVKQRLEFRKLEANNAIELYFKILFTPVVSDDQEDFLPKTFLKLAGVITTQEGRLEIRNRVYEEVLGIDWFRENYVKYFNKSLDELEARYRPQELFSSSDLDRLRSIEQDQIELSAVDLSKLFDDYDDNELDSNPFSSTRPPIAYKEAVDLSEEAVDLSEEQEAKLAAMRQRRQALSTSRRDNSYLDLKARVQNKLLSEMGQNIDLSNKNDVRIHIEELFNSILADESLVLSRAERNRLFESIVADILGFGPLEVLLADETVTAIMVNGPKNVFVEQKGHISRANIVFDNDEHILRILDRIIAPLGRRMDEGSPLVRFRLPDGSRGTAIIRPISLGGPTITLRKFPKRPLTIEDLIRFGSMTVEISQFLRACIIARIPMLVVGGAGSGKQTLMNVLSSFIPNDERIITIEHTAELQLRQEHVVTLETRPPNIEGRGEVTIEDLAGIVLQMNADRIIFGDLGIMDVSSYLDTAVRVGGSLATVHADDADAALNFLEMSVLRTNPNLTVEHVRNWISGTIKLIIVQQRLRDGSRKVTQMVEVTKLAPGRYGLEFIYEFEQTGIEGGRIIGRIKPTGRRPSFIHEIETVGIYLPPSVFGVGRNY